MEGGEKTETDFASADAQVANDQSAGAQRVQDQAVGSQDGGLDLEAERLRAWYESETGQSLPTREETIGILGSRSHGDTSRKSRYARLIHILGIVRKYDILHGLTPKTMRRMLEELGPTFVKAGQILSMRSEILPEPFCRELAKLRTEVDPMPREVMLDTLRAEYDVPIEEIFDAIDDVPLGSASVAQVHKARLVTGETVAVKVQRPGIRSVMAQDIDIVRSLARRADRFMGDEQFVDITSVIEELWQSFREETDFLVEAHSLEEFRHNNAKCAYVTCPRPFMGLCTRHVVVMDYIEGIPIAHYGELRAQGYDLEEIGVKVVENYVTQLLDDGFFHADPHPGNILISGGKIAYIDLGIMGRLSAHDRRAISEMLFAVGEGDTVRLKDGLLMFATGTETTEIDHARLLADLDLVVRNYGMASFGELDLARFLSAIVTLARRNGLELPGSVTMLGRTMVTLEGTVEDMLENDSIVDILTNRVRRETHLLEETKREAETLVIESRRATHGLLNAAAQTSEAMNMLTRGQLRMNFKLVGSDDPIADFGHAFDRLTMGIVIAGLFIGSSIIYFSGVKPLVLGVPLLGFVGFLTALILGVWLVVRIMREGRRK